MKTVILLVICVSLATTLDLNLTQAQKDAVIGYANECINQEGITKEQAMELRNGNFDKVDDKMKCFGNCFLEKLGFMVDGELKPDVVLEKLSLVVSPEQIKKAQAKCDSIKGADKCDTAIKLYQCYYDYHVEFNVIGVSFAY